MYVDRLTSVVKYVGRVNNALSNAGDLNCQTRKSLMLISQRFMFE